MRDVSEGEPVRRYNQIIGFATRPITAGEHVHVHNLGMADFVKDYAYGVDAKATDYVSEPATFQESSVPTDAWRRATTSAFSHP